MSLRNAAGERRQQPDRVLGGGGDGRLGRVGDHDSAPGGGRDIHVVDPHARAADHFEAAGSLDQIGAQLRRRTDHDRVVVADARAKIAVRVHVDVEALTQELDTRLGDRLPDEDPSATQTGVCSKASSARVTAAPRSTSAPSSTNASSTAASAVVMSKTS